MPAVGGRMSKSAAPSHVLRKVIDSGSSERPESRTLENVPFPRRFASGPPPPTICHDPPPPCSADSGLSLASKSPPASQVNLRVAVDATSSMSMSAAVPDGHHVADVVKGPS